MAKTLPSLVVAAHIHHPASSQRTQTDGTTRQVKLGVSSFKKRHGHGVSKGLLKSGEFRAPSIRTRELKDAACGPLSPIEEDSYSNAPISVPADRSTTPSIFPSPEAVPTTTSSPAKAHTVKLANDKVKKMKERGDTLESRIQDLENLAYEFKGRVQDVSYEYKCLRAQIDHVAQEFETLEDDHMTALDSLDEERRTAMDYLMDLRNAEVEIVNLYQALPDGAEATFGGFSQAKSTKPILGRYALE